MITKEDYKIFAEKIRDIHYEFYAIDYNFEDNYIDFGMYYVDTLRLTKKGYEKYEKLVNKLTLNTENFEIYLSNDCSGFNYWTKLQQESNYLHLVIAFKDDSKNPTDEEVDSIWDFMNKVYNEYDIILNNNERKRK